MLYSLELVSLFCAILLAVTPQKLTSLPLTEPALFCTNANNLVIDQARQQMNETVRDCKQTVLRVQKGCLNPYGARLERQDMEVSVEALVQSHNTTLQLREVCDQGMDEMWRSCRERPRNVMNKVSRLELPCLVSYQKMKLRIQQSAQQLLRMESSYQYRMLLAVDQLKKELAYKIDEVLEYMDLPQIARADNVR